MKSNIQITIPELPTGKLTESHFKLIESDIKPPKKGEILLKNIILSIDAANRAWMQGATYRQAIEPGDVMHGYGICQVEDANNSKFEKGDFVFAEIGWQQFGNISSQKVSVCPNYRPLSHLLSVLGIAGKTAHHGLFQVGKIKEGETLLVSGAAGSVGNIVGQIGRIKGAHVVGIAGGEDKCEWLVNEVGFDACLNYKAGKLGKAIAKTCPKGVDVYFDNVGGNILQSALFNMNKHGRIICCGAVSLYDGGPLVAPIGIPGLLVVKRLKMEGFIVFDFPDKDNEAENQIRNWIEKKQITVHEDIISGLSEAPRALVGLLNGENRGKRMVEVNSPS